MIGRVPRRPARGRLRDERGSALLWSSVVVALGATPARADEYDDPPDPSPTTAPVKPAPPPKPSPTTPEGTTPEDDAALGAYEEALTMNRGLLQQELSRLLETLRQRLHDPVMKVQIVLDEARAQELRPAPPKRPVTAKEKLDKMKEINPLVDDLLKRFELKMDD